MCRLDTVVPPEPCEPVAIRAGVDGLVEPHGCLAFPTVVCTACFLSGHRTRGLIILKCLLVPTSAWTGIASTRTGVHFFLSVCVLNFFSLG